MHEEKKVINCFKSKDNAVFSSSNTVVVSNEVLREYHYFEGLASQPLIYAELPKLPQIMSP